MSNTDLIRRLRELHAEVQHWSEYPDYDLDVVGLSADALEAAEARIRDLERVLAIGGADAYAEQFARAEAAEAEVARLREERDEAVRLRVKAAADALDDRATAIREAEARGLERAIQAINNHPVQYHADTTLHSNVASVVAQCLAAIRAEKERTP